MVKCRFYIFEESIFIGSKSQQESGGFCSPKFIHLSSQEELKEEDSHVN